MAQAQRKKPKEWVANGAQLMMKCMPFSAEPLISGNESMFEFDPSFSLSHISSPSPLLSVWGINSKSSQSNFDITPLNWLSRLWYWIFLLILSVIIQGNNYQTHLFFKNEKQKTKTLSNGSLASHTSKPFSMNRFCFFLIYLVLKFYCCVFFFFCRTGITLNHLY